MGFQGVRGKRNVGVGEEELAVSAQRPPDLSVVTNSSVGQEESSVLATESVAGGQHRNPINDPGILPTQG